MRKDSPNLMVRPDDPSTEGRPDSLRLRVAKFAPVLVWGLVFGTSAAVASLSWWLVPPYLLLMGVLLFEPAGRRVNATNPAGPVSVSSEAHASVDTSDPVVNAGSNALDSSAGVHAPATAATATKVRRATKSRSKKSRLVVEPAPAAWVQVAPGKFVRVEPGSPLAGIDAYAPPPRLDEPERPQADSGPHDHPPEDAIEYAQPDSTSPADPLLGEPRSLDPSQSDPTEDSHNADSLQTFGVSDSLEDRTLTDVADVSRPADEAEAAEAEGDLPDVSLSEPFDAPEDHGHITEEYGASDHEPESAEAEVFQGDEPEETMAEADEELADDAEAEDDEDERDDSIREEPERGTFATGSGAFRRMVGPVPDLGPIVPPSRWNVRSNRADRLPTGFRRRSPRGVGRQRHLLRAFPPRSPPGRGVVQS